MRILKSIAQRGTALGSAVALLAATVFPSAVVFADALNPLTDRSLTLSSSSPGWDYKDGSGNTTYAQPNSGANGKQSGNTFDFKVSTDTTGTPLKAMTFQYCTAPAGICTGPGDIPYTGSSGSYSRATNAAAESTQKSDLEVVTSSPAEVSTGNFGSIINSSTGVPSVIPNRNNSQGNYVVYYYNGSAWVQDDGWTMTVDDNQGASGAGTVAAGTSTGKANMITLTNSAGSVGYTSGTQVKVVFFGTDTNYITNPGSGAFFVKINTYNDDVTLDNTTLVDGGVTVANVMNQSIQIQTKVLETMDFSVGTVDPYTLASTGSTGSQLHTANGQTRHGQCDQILQGMTPSDTKNTLLLGNTAAENSLETGKTYSTHSYWRLSSNSSAGATVYYSGVTLKNTVGDEITAIGTNPQGPLRGTPQFGLALANGTNLANGSGPYTVDYSKETNGGTGVYENGADQAVGGIHASVATDITFLGLTGYHAPQLWPLVPGTAYDQGAGNVNSEYGSVNTEFAFDPNANLIPAPLATENNSVVDCVTGKVRYIANIAATTPAGIYTTKINYIAAPQY